MNYDFRRFWPLQFFARSAPSTRRSLTVRLSSLFTRYAPGRCCPPSCNLLDSHDVSRFLTLCGGDRARMRTGGAVPDELSRNALRLLRR